MTINLHDDYVVDASQTLVFSNEAAFVFKAKGVDLSLDNFGDIQVDGAAWAISGTRQQGADLFWNHLAATLTVDGGTDNATAVWLAGPGSQVRNDGVIEVSGRLDIGVHVQALDSRILNTGEITVTGTGFASGVEGFGGLVKNTGQITAQSAGPANGVTITSQLVNVGDIHAEGGGGAVGLTIDLSGDVQLHAAAPAFDAVVKNGGSIVAVSHDAGHPSAGITFVFPVEGVTTRIVNSGHIEGDYAIDATNRGIGISLDNSGELVGDVVLGLQSGVIANTGSIAGDVTLGSDDDVYRGGHGHLTGVLHGSYGDDRLVGGDDNDAFYGDATLDDVRDGADLLQGHGGDDSLAGGGADDTLEGGAGADVLTGGTGADTFTYATVGASTALQSDLITDLESGDSIDLSAIDADTTTGGDQAFALVGGFTGHAAELTLTYDSGADETLLRGDVDGDGQADLVIRMSGDQTGFTGIVL